MKYTFESVKSVQAVAPASAAAGAINGSAIDTVGFGDGIVVVSVGVTAGTPTSFTVNAKVQESANGSSGWADITGAAITEVTAASKTAEIAISLAKRSASLRYVRVVLTPAFVGGTTPTVGVSAVALLGNPEMGSLVANSVAGN